jgi:hypothetical protein
MPSHPIFETENPQYLWLTSCEMLGDGMLKTVAVSIAADSHRRELRGCGRSLFFVSHPSGEAISFVFSLQVSQALPYFQFIHFLRFHFIVNTLFSSSTFDRFFY